MAVVLSSSIKSREATFGVRSATSVTDTYLVITDSPATALEVVNGATLSSPHPVPELYDYLGSGAYVLSATVEQLQPDNYTKWLVTVNGGILEDDETEAVPTSRGTLYWMETLTETERVDEDASGNPIVNTAEQPLEDIILRDRDLMVFAIQKNYSTLGAINDLNRTYNNTVNSDTIATGVITGSVAIQPRELKYAGTTASRPKYENQVLYYEGVTRLIHRPETWDVTRVSKGFKKIINVNVIANILDGEGQQVSEPQNLDANGDVVGVGGTPFEQTFEIYSTAAFTPLF